MNYDNLHEIINRYEKDLDIIYGGPHYEMFKLKAVKAWHDAFKNPDATGSFGERFMKARKQFSVLLDNSSELVSSCVKDLWQKEPETVEHLFNDVLLADPENNVSKIRENMFAFVDGFEALRLRYFPKSWKYKQSLHTASVLLALDKPDICYMYKYNIATKMAEYIDFDTVIGQGNNTNIEAYYRMCDLIAEAMKEHPSLIEKRRTFMTEEMYTDDNLHFAVFELMWCAPLQYRGYYTGLVPSPIGKNTKKTKYMGPSDDELLRKKELARRERIEELRLKIEDLDMIIDDQEDISLVGVEVTDQKYGKGSIKYQQVNAVGIQFENVMKEYRIHEKFKMRPVFENDEEIVHALSVYADAYEARLKLKKELEELIKEA